jgi:hypothetical protein
VEWAPVERLEVEVVPRAAAAALQARLVQRAVVEEMLGVQEAPPGQPARVAEAELLVRLVQEARRARRVPVEPVALLSLRLRAARPMCAPTVVAAPEVPVT